MAKTLSINNIQLYENVRQLINIFNSNNISFKNALKNSLDGGKTDYLGYSLQSYVWFLSRINPEFKADLQFSEIDEETGLRISKLTPERFLEILEKFSKDQKNVTHLEEEIQKLKEGEIEHPDFVTDEEHQEIVKANPSPEGGTHGLDAFIAHQTHPAHPIHTTIIKEEPVKEAAKPETTQLNPPEKAVPILPIGTPPGQPQLPPEGNFKPISEVLSTNQAPQSTPNLDRTPGTSPIPESFTKAFEQSEKPSVPESSPVPVAFTKAFQEPIATPIAPQTEAGSSGLPPKTPGSQSFPGILSNFGKNVGANAANKTGIGIKSVASKYPKVIASGVTGLIGATAGAVGGQTGMFLGFGVGAAAPWAMSRQDVVNLATSAGKSMVNVGSNIVARSNIGVGGLGNRLYGSRKKLAIGRFIVILLLLLLPLLLLTGFSAPTDQVGTGVGQNLRIIKTGDASVTKGGTINYQITVTYTGQGQASIEVKDPLPAGVVGLEAKDGVIEQSGAGENTTYTAKWSLNNMASNQPKILSLSARAPDRDVWITNTAEAILLSSTGGSSGGSGGSGNLPPSSTDFDTLMRGQGRNINILGDENNFTETVISNAGNSYNLRSKESYIKQIYRAAVAKNVNPLIILTLWGEEGGFGLRGDRIGNTTILWELGCDPHGGKFVGFERQIQCSVDTWVDHMDRFDRTKGADGTVTLPSQRGRTCVYNDPFLYAAEKYGPDCTAFDHNDHFRKNFVKFYNLLLGR